MLVGRWRGDEDTVIRNAKKNFGCADSLRIVISGETRSETRQVVRKCYSVEVIFRPECCRDIWHCQVNVAHPSEM